MRQVGPFTWQFLAVLMLIAVAVIGLALWLPPELVVLLTAVGLMALVYFSGAVYLLTRPEWLPKRFEKLPIVLGALFPLVVGVVVFPYYRDLLTLTTVIFAIGLLFVFLYYWLVVPLALFQKIRTQNRSFSVEDWPPITVLVPAYNEEFYVGECLDSIHAAGYPNEVTIITVDDGSSDSTSEEAFAHSTDNDLVLTKPNGGKHDALNLALEYVDTEIIVSVDADSRIHPNALTEIVREFQYHENAGAIAGNIKVDNRGSVVTGVQALEYIVGINTFRRALDLFGTVTVVPGSLGAFRRDVLEEAHGYSADTLTEDFDLTIEILKRGYSIHASEAIVYTEAPDTWRDLWKQRRRWFQGNFQTLVKHREVFFETRFGLLHRVAFPYVFLSMSVLPLLGFAILVLIGVSLVTGETGLFIQLAVFFIILQVLLSALAILIEGEDLRLVILAPMSIFGYKQFLDIVLFRSLEGLLPNSKTIWLKPSRVKQRVTPTTVSSETDQSVGDSDNAGEPATTTEDETTVTLERENH